MSYLREIAIAAVTIAVLSVLIHGGVFGQSASEDNKQTIEQFTQQVINECSILFDTGDTTTKQSILCDSMMQAIDKECQVNYFGFCFGDAWINFFSDHMAEGKKAKCKVDKYEDGSKGKLCIGQKIVFYENDNGHRGKKHVCIVADFNGHCTQKGLYYDWSLYKRDNNGKVIFPN